jgi:antitoxin component YwqK of YwqJK toxin-antitoxin module
MKNKIFYLIFPLLFASYSIQAQSKKKQILVLTNKTDSLNKIISKENLKLDSLNKICQRKSVIIDSLISQISLLNQTIKKNNELFKESNKNLVSINEKLQLRSSKLEDSILNQKFQKNINYFEKNDFDYDNYDFSFTKNPNVGYPENKNLNGNFESYYSSNNVYWKNKKKLPYAKGSYKNGFKDGHWIYYQCDGSTRYEGDFKNGIKEGIWQNYDFCHEIFKFNFNDVYGYYDFLLTLKSYYNFNKDLGWDLFKEEIHFRNGIPSDTINFFNDKNQLKLKVSMSDRMIYYDNNQTLTNQKCTFSYPYLSGDENNELIIFFRNGNIKYKKNTTGPNVTELYFNVNGKVTMKGEYLNGEGKCTQYDENGKIQSEFSTQIAGGKWGQECPCQ